MPDLDLTIATIKRLGDLEFEIIRRDALLASAQAEIERLQALVPEPPTPPAEAPT